MKNPCNNCSKSLFGYVPGKHCLKSQAFRDYRRKRMPRIIHHESKRKEER